MTDERANEIVEMLFKDLRDRRFLKWLFCDDPENAGPILHDSHGAPLMPLDSEVQDEIRASWKAIIQERMLYFAYPNQIVCDTMHAEHYGSHSTTGIADGSKSAPREDAFIGPRFSPDDPARVVSNRRSSVFSQSRTLHIVCQTSRDGELLKERGNSL